MKPKKQMWLALLLSATLLGGCGGSNDKPATATTPDRADELNGIVSAYLSKIINEPGAARDTDAGEATVNELNLTAADQPAACSAAVAKVSGEVVRIDLSPSAKRKQILDRMLAVYGDCP